MLQRPECSGRSNLSSSLSRDSAKHSWLSTNEFGQGADSEIRPVACCLCPTKRSDLSRPNEPITEICRRFHRRRGIDHDYPDEGRGCRTPQYRPRVAVANTQREVLE